MYYNFNIAKTNGLTPDDVFTLQMVYQNSSEQFPIQEEIEKRDLTNLEKYISQTKKGKTILNKQGKELYQKVTSSFETIEEDFLVMKWIVGEYERADKMVGSKTKILYYISAIRTEMGISPKKMLILLQEFISDKDQFKWSNKLENLLFNPGNVFRTKFSLTESPLYQYYERYQNIIDEKFEQVD